jgi:plasmid stabilization system protein ParE
MAKVSWSIHARNDLDKITDYYAIEFPRYAETLSQDILSKTKALETYPRIGRIIPEIGEVCLRELIYRNYRIMYLLDEETNDVEILSIFHSSKQFGSDISGESK